MWSCTPEEELCPKQVEKMTMLLHEQMKNAEVWNYHDGELLASRDEERMSWYAIEPETDLTEKLESVGVMVEESIV